MDNLRAIISTIFLFIGIFFTTTVALWFLWNLVMPAIGVSKVGYWTFIGLYAVVRGLLADPMKLGSK